MKIKQNFIQNVKKCSALTPRKHGQFKAIHLSLSFGLVGKFDEEFVKKFRQSLRLRFGPSTTFWTKCLKRVFTIVKQFIKELDKQFKNSQSKNSTKSSSKSSINNSTKSQTKRSTKSPTMSSTKCQILLYVYTQDNPLGFYLNLTQNVYFKLSNILEHFRIQLLEFEHSNSPLIFTLNLSIFFTFRQAFCHA